MLPIILIAVLILFAVLAWFARGWWSHRNLAVRAAKARATLARELPRLEREFLPQAAASGKPRGLEWVECKFQEGALFATDRSTSDVIALIGVTVRFEAVPGGGMEEVEAVCNLRYATAVLVYRDLGWTSEGRVVFNLGPQETLEKYRDNLVPLGN